MYTAHGAEQKKDRYVRGASIHNARSIRNRDPWIFSNDTLRNLLKKYIIQDRDLPLAAQAMASI